MPACANSGANLEHDVRVDGAGLDEIEAEDVVLDARVKHRLVNVRVLVGLAVFARVCRALGITGLAQVSEAGERLWWNGWGQSARQSQKRLARKPACGTTRGRRDARQARAT